jgi:DHA1 family multidrug resistance protein-like MFS transporter
VKLTSLVERWALPTSMFLGTFAWSFVYVSLPFYVHAISPYDEATTVRWTGWILGISSLMTVVTAPISGRLVHGRDPKHGFVLVQGFQGLGFVFMAMARSLTQMFFARVLLGLMGAVSTFAFIMAGRARGDIRREIAAIQSSMTLGQVLGPPVGAVAAARLGFQRSFVLAAFMLWSCSLLVGVGVPSAVAVEVASTRRGRTSIREIATASLLVLTASVQVFFLTAILPQVLPPLGIAPGVTLEVGGLILFVSGIGAALGSLATPRLADLVGERRAVPWALAGSSLLLALLALATDVWTFSAVRVLQMLCIAPVFPLAVASIAQRASGQAIGVVNSARIGASFLGPVLATTLLTWVSPGAVYGILSALGLALVPIVMRLTARRRTREGNGP